MHGSHEGGGVRLEGGDGLVGVHAPALPVVQAHHVRHHDQPCFLSLDMQGKKSTHTQPKNMSLSFFLFCRCRGAASQRELTVKAKRASLVMSQCHGKTEERLRLLDDSPGHQKCPSSLGRPKASETSKSASSLKI